MRETDRDSEQRARALEAERLRPVPPKPPAGVFMPSATASVNRRRLADAIGATDNYDRHAQPGR